MPYFVLLVTTLLLASCQNNQPSQQEQQRAEQAAVERQVEVNFEKALRQQRLQLETQQQQATLYVSPEKAADLLNTAQLLFNLDSNELPAPSPIATTPQHGGLLLRVRDHQETYDQIQALAQEQGLVVLEQTEQLQQRQKGSIIQLQAPADKMQPTLERIRDFAAVLRKKQLWQMPTNNDHLRVKSELLVNQKRLQNLRSQLKDTEEVRDQLLIRENIAELSQQVELTVLNLREQASQSSPSTLTIAFYEELAPVVAPPTTFSADLSGNLETGWNQFKQFLLQAALLWPYIIIGLLFLIIILLAIGSSRRKAREFKLKLLHRQQPLVQPVIVDDTAL